MKYLRRTWWSWKMRLFQRLRMHSAIAKMFLDHDNVKRLSVSKLKRIVKYDVVVPNNQRIAALQLYELGEKDFAVNFLVEQVSLCLLQDTPRQIKIETCGDAAIALSRIKDPRAIAPLLNTLGELPFFKGAYALAHIGGDEIAVELMKFASLERRKGRHAIIGLGFMKHEAALPYLIRIVERSADITRFDSTDDTSILLKYHASKLLGLYDDERAKNLFLASLTKERVRSLLSDYVGFERYPDAYHVGWESGWEVVKKHGWDRYVRSDAQRFAMWSVHISHWSSYYRPPCPFMLEDEVVALRNEISETVWSAAKERNGENLEH